MRTFWLLATLSLGLATIVKALQVSLTPAAWAVLRDTADRLLASSGFGFLAALTGIAFLLSLSAAAWERAERRCEREQRRSLNVKLEADADEAIARLSLLAEQLRKARRDTSSLIDDSPNDCGKDAA